MTASYSKLSLRFARFVFDRHELLQTTRLRELRKQQELVFLMKSRRQTCVQFSTDTEYETSYPGAWRLVCVPA